MHTSTLVDLTGAVLVDESRGGRNGRQVPEPQISVVDRLSQREQIELVLARARQKLEPVRIRIPVTLYEYGDTTRNYLALRDASWNLQLPATETTVETIERLVQGVQTFIRSLELHGVEETIQLLGGESV